MGTRSPRGHTRHKAALLPKLSALNRTLQP
jgi:hypothetical protein